MNSRKGSRLTLPFLAAIVLMALPSALKFLAPDAAISSSLLTPKALLWTAGLAKLLFLLAAAVLAWRSSSAFERKTPSRAGWRRLSWGFLESFVGQAYLFVSQVYTGAPAPFPSLADFFFLAAYCEFIYALLAFLRGYKESGYPIGTVAERRATAVITALVCAVIAVPVLKPILESGAGGPEKTLNVVYTLLDFVLLIPTVVLLRITLRFPGGAVWRVWIALLGGFVFVCAGDILFAWFTGFSMPQLDPLVDLMYIVGYGCLALGAAYQRELVA